MGAGKVDLDYLMRYTNAAHLVDQDPRSATYGLFLRDKDGAELVWDREKRRAVPWNAPGVKPAMSGTVNIGPTHAKPVFQLMADAYLDPTHAPGGRGRGHRHPRRHDPPHRRRTRPHGLRGGDHPRPPLDRFPGRAARDHDRPPGQLPRHARHLGPFQRLPDLPRPAPAPDHPRQRRDPRRLPLQAALPQAGRRPSAPASQGHPRLSARRPASGLSARPRGSGARRRRPPQTHRQGLHLGGAALGPRPDAHGHLERRRRRSLPHRHAVPLHGEHGLELVDEYAPRSWTC